MSSWASKVIADASGEWCGNSLRFATQEEARSYVHELAGRWLAVRQTKTVETTDPITHRWDENRNQALSVVLEPTPQ